MRQFKFLWQRWHRLAEAIGNFQARVLLTGFYFLIVMPFALGVRLCSDPLRIKVQPSRSGWLPREPRGPSLEAARRQS